MAERAAVVATGHRAAGRRGALAWVGSHAAASADPDEGARLGVAALEEALRSVGFGLDDLVRVGAYYDESVDDGRVRAAVLKAIPPRSRPVLSLLPVREPVVPGAALVLDAAAASGERTSIGTGDATEAVRVGDRVWIAGTRGDGDGILAQTRSVIDRLRRLTSEAGAELDDCVKMNISYLGGGTEADWEPTAKLRGSAFREPAAAATGVPFPRLPGGAVTQFEMLAVAGSTGTRRHGWPEGHWDWPIHLPWKHGCRSGDLVTVGGQVSLDGHGRPIDPDDLARQTDTALQNIERVLATVGARMADVTQVTAFFEGSPADLETILVRTRGAFGPEPPPLVPVPLPFLAYDEMVVEIEVIAVAASPSRHLSPTPPGS